MYEREQSTNRVWGHLAASSFTVEGRKTASENYAIYFDLSSVTLPHSSSSYC